MTRLGLIGAGRWGRIYIKTIAELDGVSLARLASRNPESARLTPSGCIISSDWRELIAAGDLDGVIVATPPALHAEMASAAVAAGLPALVEKPLVLALAEAMALRDLAHARRGLVMVDHTHLYHPAFEELKRQAPLLGAICVVESEAGNHGPYRADVPVLWDWGPHDVAMCLDLIPGSPLEIHAERQARQKHGNVDAETLRLELVFATGERARIRLSNMIDKTRRFAVRCDEGTLVYDDLAPHKLVLQRGARGAAETPVSVSSEPPLQRVVKAFIAAIASGGDRTSSLDLAVEVTAVLERCAKALSAG